MILKALPNTSIQSGELKLYAFVNDEAVGCLELYNYDPINRRAAVGIVVGSSFRRQGIGFQMLNELTCFCRANLSLHQLYADIAASNQASLRLFERAGYQCCGILHDWVKRDGAWLDTHRYQLIISKVHE